MNEEQMKAEMELAPKETQIEFASALAGYIMIGMAHAKENGKDEFDIEAMLPMLDMVKQAIEGKLRIVEVKTATEIMTKSVKSGMFDSKHTTVKGEL